MKHAVCTLLLLAAPVGAAGFPPSSALLSDCENHWFLKEYKDPNARLLGFAYVDPSAGVTVEHNGEVVIGADGAFVRKTDPERDKMRLITRVTSNLEIACLSAEQAAQLGLPPVSQWLEHYKDERTPGPHNVAWAKHYNEIGAFGKALEFLKIASDSSYAALELDYERGFALNALERYDEAMPVLEAASKANPDNVALIAELAYALAGKHEFARAIDLYEQAISKDKKSKSARRAEFAQNIANCYNALGDAKNANKWHEKAEKWKAEQ